MNGNNILRFIVLLIFGLIVIGYSVSMFSDYSLASIIGIAIGCVMIGIGTKKLL